MIILEIFIYTQQLCFTVCEFEGLQKPVLEKDFLPVIVVLAANPSNFIVSHLFVY